MNPTATLPLNDYPRPQLRRGSFLNLNGLWNYAITEAPEAPTSWDGEILVPYSPESKASGVERTLLPGQYLWYKRTLSLPREFSQDKVLLHFGAVDQDCVIYIDGIHHGEHRGGYLPFSLDVTEALGDGAEHVLQVRVQDESDSSHRSRGKQSLKRGGIWYTAQSGIWQTVWIESVPQIHVRDLQLRPRLEHSALEVRVQLEGISVGTASAETPIEVVLSAEGQEISRARGQSGQSLMLPVNKVRRWSPEDPFLYDVRVSAGTDTVESYVGMRSVGVGPDSFGIPRMLLNGKPYFHSGVLDQGYWPEGLYTPPDDAAMVRDITAMKERGFTMLRKHIKIEPLRWYYHCDKLGMLVWQDMVNGGETYTPSVITAPVLLPVRLDDRRHRLFSRGDTQGRNEFLAEVDATVVLLINSPSVAVWVPFNEGWGQFDARSVAERVRTLDPDRIIDHASGWHDQGAGQLRSLHVYFRKIRPRRAWGRDGRAVVVSEYGGYSMRLPGHEFGKREFGYRRYADAGKLGAAYADLHRNQVAPAIDAGLAAMVYTQLSDVEDEANGLLTYDRSESKIDPDLVRTINHELAQRFAVATGVAAPAELSQKSEETMSKMLVEREITAPVALVRSDGTLNPDAVGFSRTPLHDTSGIGSGTTAWGRNKRWEYWAVTTPEHILALTVSSLDYAAVHAVMVYERATGRVFECDAVAPLAGTATLPASAGSGPTRATTKKLQIAIDEVPGGTLLRGKAAGISFEVTAHRPTGHQSLGVVVPFSKNRFQYTLKDVARPATGWLEVEGIRHELPDGESWAVLDHGRGRWPYKMTWNWGAASGKQHGEVLGLQLGGKWTDGSGSTENSLLIDGTLHKISEELDWNYDTTDWLAPWTITGDTVELTFEPFWDRSSSTELVVFGSRGHQCFGHYTGTVLVGDRKVQITQLLGWAEEMRNRW